MEPHVYALQEAEAARDRLDRMTSGGVVLFHGEDTAQGQR